MIEKKKIFLRILDSLFQLSNTVKAINKYSHLKSNPCVYYSVYNIKRLKVFKVSNNEKLIK